MQFKLILHPSEIITLPLSYHGTVQGAIYHALSASPEYSAFLHDKGFHFGQRAYKLFTFSLLEGPHSIKGRCISFPGPIHLEIRSPKEDFCRVLFTALQRERAFVLAEHQLSITDFAITDYHIRENHADIKMRSPLCLSRTIVEGEKKKTLYLSPEDREFLPLMRENFRRKYTAAYGIEPDCKISVAPCGEMRKYVTRFQQNIYVTAWQGRFSLAGPPEALDFLYQTGLGSRNSQGFGMFDILP